MNVLRAATVFSVCFSLVGACGGSSNSGSTTPGGLPLDGGPRGVEQAGQACSAPAQCYGAIDGGVDGGGDGGSIKGAVTCLTKVTNGYCTHTCSTDADCCAVPGECLTGVKQVCSPFTNDSTKYCFLSCEDADVGAAISANADAGYYDGGAVDSGTREDAFCHSFASAYANCRSSGGGTQNRKVCIPQQ